MIDIFLRLIGLVWTLGQALRLTTPEFPLKLHLIDVLVFILFIRLIFYPKFWKLFLYDKISLGLIMFASAVLISLLANFPNLSLTTSLSAISYALRFFVYFSVYYAFRLSLFIPSLNRFAFIFVILGFYQYFFMSDLRFLKAIGYDDHLYRLTGFIFDPNFTGLILVVIFLFALQGGRVAISYLQSIFLLSSIALTFSRASYLTLGFSIAVLAFITRRPRYVFILVTLALIVFFVPKPFGEGVNLIRLYSIISRLDTYQHAISLFLSRPLFGVGFNTLGQGGGIDNSFLFVLATTGIVGFSTFIYLLVISFQKVTDLIPRLSLAAILFHSLFNNSFFQSSILLLWIAIIAAPKVQSST